MSDIFGFPKKSSPIKFDITDDIDKQFAISKFILGIKNKHLMSQKGRESFFSDIRWGTGAGTIRLKITPNWRIIVERFVPDLSGNSEWVVKLYAKPNTDKFGERESVVVDYLYKELQKIDKENLDVAKKDFKIHSLVNFLSLKFRSLKETPFYFSKIVDKGDNHKILQFDVANSGVGQIVGQNKDGPIALMAVEINFNKDKGLIKAIIYTISLEGESNSWNISTPIFDGYFAPSQSNEEISRVLLNCILFY